MNIYVGNLAYSMSEDELRGLFEEYGSVDSVKIITDKYSGQSKGFGFVEMAEDDQAEEAIERLNGSEIKGRSLKVNKALPRKEKPFRNRPEY